MKTQTAKNNTARAIEFAMESDIPKIRSWQESMVDYAELISKERIEALRERLINDSLQLVTVQKINSIVNEFLKEINDGKNID